MGVGVQKALSLSPLWLWEIKADADLTLRAKFSISPRKHLKKLSHPWNRQRCLTGDRGKSKLQKENLYEENSMTMLTTTMETFAFPKTSLRRGESQVQVQRRHSPSIGIIQGVSCKTNVPIQSIHNIWRRTSEGNLSGHELVLNVSVSIKKCTIKPQFLILKKKIPLSKNQDPKLGLGASETQLSVQFPEAEIQTKQTHKIKHKEQLTSTWYQWLQKQVTVSSSPTHSQTNKRKPTYFPPFCSY